MDLDFVQGKMELGGALFTVLLAEFVFLALELHHLLARCLQQRIAPDRIIVRVVVGHGYDPQSCGPIPQKPETAKRFGAVGLRKDDDTPAARS